MTGGPVVALAEESIALFEELAEVLETGIVTLDRDLVIRRWNRWFAVASGMDAAAAVGRPLVDVFPELSDGPAEAAMHRALEGITTVWAHRFHGYMFPMPAPAGYQGFSRMQQSAHIMPMRRDDAIEGVVVLVQDVTDRVAREEELRAAVERAETASQAKSEFLASMSHELRTPLSAVVGYMELFEGDMVGPVPPQHKMYLRRVKSAAYHLINIVEEILTFARVDAGREEVHPELLDAVALAREVELLLEPQALLKRLSLSLDVPDAPVTIRTDPTKLRQILINLAGNAVKFTDAGEVRMELTTTETQVRFRIRDQGPGVAPVNLERIFEPFTQVDQSLKRSKGGTGLGLPVSRRLAHLLGGELSVESTLNEGSVFTLLLPLEMRPTQSVEAVAPATPAPHR